MKIFQGNIDKKEFLILIKDYRKEITDLSCPKSKKPSCYP